MTYKAVILTGGPPARPTRNLTYYPAHNPLRVIPLIANRGNSCRKKPRTVRARTVHRRSTQKSHHTHRAPTCTSGSARARLRGPHSVALQRERERERERPATHLHPTRRSHTALSRPSSLLNNAQRPHATHVPDRQDTQYLALGAFGGYSLATSLAALILKRDQ